VAPLTRSSERNSRVGGVAMLSAHPWSWSPKAVAMVAPGVIHVAVWVVLAVVCLVSAIEWAFSSITFVVSATTFVFSAIAFVFSVTAFVFSAITFVVSVIAFVVSVTTFVTHSVALVIQTAAQALSTRALGSAPTPTPPLAHSPTQGRGLSSPHCGQPARVDDTRRGPGAMALHGHDRRLPLAMATQSCGHGHPATCPCTLSEER